MGTTCPSEGSIDPGAYGAFGNAMFTPGASNDSIIYQENASGYLALTEIVRYNGTKLKHSGIVFDENWGPEAIGITRSPGTGNIYVTTSGSPGGLYGFAPNGTALLGSCTGLVTLEGNPNPMGT
jgi:hypothetical protein